MKDGISVRVRRRVLVGGYRTDTMIAAVISPQETVEHLMERLVPKGEEDRFEATIVLKFETPGKVVRLH